MKKYLCAEAGCNALSDTRYCPKHLRIPAVPFANAKRYNTDLYNTARWRKLRNEALEYSGFRCCRCGALFADDLQVHHKIRPMGNEELFYDPRNLEVVCIFCHRVETARQCRTKDE
jgi:5-methylcytosine-specific restriction endonuclease McrA